MQMKAVSEKATSDTGKDIDDLMAGLASRLDIGRKEFEEAQRSRDGGRQRGMEGWREVPLSLQKYLQECSGDVASPPCLFSRPFADELDAREAFAALGALIQT